MSELFLSKDLTIAVDFTVIPYYGKENPMLVSDSNLPGKNLGMKFVVLSVVEGSKTFTLKTGQINPIESEVSVLGEMLDYAEEVLNPDLILPERVFTLLRRLENSNREA